MRVNSTTNMAKPQNWFRIPAGKNNSILVTPLKEDEDNIYYLIYNSRVTGFCKAEWFKTVATEVNLGVAK